MSKKSNPNASESPGSATRALQERAQRRSQAPGKPLNKLSQPQNRWQRAVRYNWDKNRGRG